MTVEKYITKKDTFNNYLGYVHMDEYPQILDDDLPDAFNNWLDDLPQELLIAHADVFSGIQCKLMLSGE